MVPLETFALHSYDCSAVLPGEYLMSTVRPTGHDSEICPVSGETSREERFNVLTHGIGLFLAVIGMVVMLGYAYLHEEPWQIASCAVYGSTLIATYAISTFYHRCTHLGRKQSLRIADHISIYFFIAGSYTPIALSPCLGEWGAILFGAVWTIALAGLVWKIYFVDRFRFISTAAYLVMGWLVVLAAEPLIENLPAEGMTWLVSGGIMYTLGTIFYLWESLPYGHGVWHLFCLGGSICHYYTILLYIVPMGCSFST